jgi:nitrogen fixation-related uncharacterized protein
MKPVAILAVLLALAAAWWLAGHPGYEDEQQRAARVEVEAQAVEAAKPKLYRWRDAKGVTQITDTPPKGRKYTVVDIEKNENVNVIPMSEAINPSGDSTSAKPAD